MIKKLYSIKYKFFLAISLIAIIFISILGILNHLFYDDYYLYKKKMSLEVFYNTINKEYSGDILEIYEDLQYFENKYGLRVRINVSNYIIYDSIYSANFSSWTQIPKNVLQYQSPLQTGVNFTFDENEFREKGYSFLTLRDSMQNDEYICLIGLFSTGDTVMAQIPVALMEENVAFGSIFLWIASLISLIACLIIAFFISSQFTKPLIEISFITKEMIKLNFSKKYTGNSQDEIGQLGQSLNTLSSHLEIAIEELRTTNIALQNEIEQKEKIDNMRKDFIINASHELKTPISVILGYAEGLKENIAESTEDRDYYCSIIIDEATQMNKLVMDLLSLSKLELGNITPKKNLFDIFDVVAPVYDKVSVLFNSRNITIDIQDCHCMFFADFDMMSQIITNFVTNAIYHTPNHGKIKIFTEDLAYSTRLSVFNEGNAIPEEELSLIWEKFYKTDKSHNRSNGGTGIGLSIVRALCDTQGGYCEAQNVENGVVFLVELPKQTDNI